MTNLKRLFIGLVAVGGLALLPAASSASSRRPVIGCIRLNDYEAGRAAWQSAPRNCIIGGTTGPLASTGGIARVRWMGWGNRTATGHGYMVDGLGFLYPAKITAFRIRKIPYYNRMSYTRLHIVAQARIRGTVRRGPFNTYVNVTPQ